MTGRERRLTTLSRYPETSLKDARSQAKGLLTGAKPKTTALKEQANKPRTVADYKRLLTRHFDSLADTSLPELSTSKIMEIIDELTETPSEQAHAFVAVKTLLRFCVGRGFLTHSPLAALQAPTKPVARDRVLSDGEVSKILSTAGKDPSTFNQIVLLCLYTGLRRSEAAGMRWTWIDTKTKTIHLPAVVTKNGRAHVFPYGRLVADLLKTVPSREGFLFPGRDSARQFFNGWSRSKQAFDKECRVTGWTLHDLRRTFATNLAALAVPVQVTERLLNHTSGVVSGVAAIYNRHSYLPEMRTAIAAWEHKLKVLARSG